MEDEEGLHEVDDSFGHESQSVSGNMGITTSNHKKVNDDLQQASAGRPLPVLPPRSKVASAMTVTPPPERGFPGDAVEEITENVRTQSQEELTTGYHIQREPRNRRSSSMGSTMRKIPRWAGNVGLPIDDSPAVHTRAVEFYKNEILPRREIIFSDSDENEGAGPPEYRKVEFGRRGGEHFPLWDTTPWDFRDFGLGVALYFQTLRAMASVFFFCGLLQAQAIEFYRSPRYSDGQWAAPWYLRGTAVCTRHERVCLNPTCSEAGDTNECAIGQAQGYVDLVMIVLLVVVFGTLAAAQDRVAALLDESIQTAQDYSVLVDDPGEDDDDPDEWRDFFQQFGHVTFVTVAKNNGPLLLALARRRVIMREIIMIIGNGEKSATEVVDGKHQLTAHTWGSEPFEDLVQRSRAETTSGCTATALSVISSKPLWGWVADLEAANAALHALITTSSFKPSKVFVTFETEVAQRKCLTALTKGILAAFYDWRTDLPPECIFKGTNVLAITEACEPAEVFWDDLDVSFEKRVWQQGTTLLITVALATSSMLIARMIDRRFGTVGSAFWISMTNMAIPELILVLCNHIEGHVSLHEQQLSLFIRLLLFRCMNTTLVLYATTAFEDMLTVKALKRIQTVLWANAITSNVIRSLNPLSPIKQFIATTFAPTQEKLNMYFLGTSWHAAERYAEMTNTLFLSLFYTALFPAGLFLAAFGFSLTYATDKYFLLRTWRTPAELTDYLTKASRVYFALAIYIHAIMATIFFAQFPFDNICLDPSHPHALSSVVFEAAARNLNVTSDIVHQRCDQAVSSRLITVFFGGSLFRDSMYGKQQRVVRAFVGLTIALSVAFFFIFFAGGIVGAYYHFIKGYYDEASEMRQFHFTDCEGIQAYIPFIAHKSLAYPLVAADLRSFESKYLSFELPEENLYQLQCLHDPSEWPGFTQDELSDLFSSVRYYPPPEGLVELPDRPKSLGTELQRRISSFASVRSSSSNDRVDGRSKSHGRTSPDSRKSNAATGQETKRLLQ